MLCVLSESENRVRRIADRPKCMCMDESVLWYFDIVCGICARTPRLKYTQQVNATRFQFEYVFDKLLLLFIRPFLVCLLLFSHLVVSYNFHSYILQAKDTRDPPHTTRITKTKRKMYTMVQSKRIVSMMRTYYAFYTSFRSFRLSTHNDAVVSKDNIFFYSFSHTQSSTKI